MSKEFTPSEPNDLSARLVEVEQTLTFQQAAFDELNRVALQQQAELDKLRGEVKSLRGLVQGLIDRGEGDDLPHEKPPHY